MIPEPQLTELVQRAASVTRGVDAALRPSLAGVVLDYLLRHSRAAQDDAAEPARAVSLGNAGALTSAETLGEAVAAGMVRSHPDRLVVIAAHRFTQQGIEAVTTDDFLEAYREVRASRPQNLHANIATCMKRGWLVQAASKEGRKAWRVTQTGLARAGDLVSGDDSA